ncbi:hypothetical protein [Pollutimonas bauzanensis]|uniref:Uncharacterized protein n=1 Tax=Pollutimonas bauzanensis TaxID=658167 RepID=A0A1M5MME4_9BURK|nr:hypothetical protein [Pollutimonas bauzanensis]SHG78415.1 hypothetical protein SAMN04488135_101262 [Pollutimonas bauzanensis]
MSYGKFVGELNKGIEGYIAAYDNKSGHGGCVLHIKGRRTILVPAAVIDHQRPQALILLRAKISEERWEAPHLLLTDRDGKLIFESEVLPAAA